MTPQQIELIRENQRILYTFRKGGANLPQKQKVELCRFLDEAFKTVSTKMQTLKKHQIILDDNFVINSELAYFAGFYMTKKEIEVELIDFQFESVLQKIAPNFPCKVTFERNDKLLLILRDLVEKLSNMVPLVAVSVAFDKCMDYDKNIAYRIKGNSFLVDETSLLLKNSIFLTGELREFVQVDTTLAYTLYLREKVFESDSIVYYDLDNGKIGYVKHNILSKELNPACQLIFPRYTDKQKEILEAFESLSDTEYESQLINILSSGIFKVFDNASLQIRSILNPNHFIIDGKWIKSSHFYKFYTQNSLYFNDTDEIVNTLYLAAPWPIIMKKEEQPQKGAAIFAAYSFFNWDLKW